MSSRAGAHTIRTSQDLMRIASGLLDTCERTFVAETGRHTVDPTDDEKLRGGRDPSERYE
jgi:hypothetical protein